MEAHKVTLEMLEQYQQYLLLEEKSTATQEKYLRDLRAFFQWLPQDRFIDKERMIAYKEWLQTQYAPSSVNSMLAALNSFVVFQGWDKLKVKQVKVQRKIFRDQGRELKKAEYQQLVWAAREKRKDRLCLVMQTICATGIRVSELSSITVEAVQKGFATVACKGKTRTVFLPGRLRQLLEQYIKKQKVSSGSIFVTRSGKPLHRSNIWAEMKRLCRNIGMVASKVFPHNLRHLFACTYYEQEKDIVKLADLLGHSSIDTTRIYTITTGREHEQQLTTLNLVLDL